MSQVDKRTLDLIGSLSTITESSGPESVVSSSAPLMIQSDTDNFLIDALMPEPAEKLTSGSPKGAKPSELRSEVLESLKVVSNNINELLESDDEYAVANYLIDSLVDLLGGSPHE